MEKNKDLSKHQKTVKETAASASVPEPVAEATKTPIVETPKISATEADKKPADELASKPPKKKYSGLFVKIFLAVLLLSAGFVFAFLALKKEFNSTGFIVSRKINYASEYEEKFGHVCYGSVFDCKDVEFETSDTVNTEELGEHEINIKAKSGDNVLELKQTVVVVDEEAPVISAEIEQLKVCPNDVIPQFDFTIQDNYDGDISEKATIAHDKDKGIVTISIEDTNRNSSVKEIPATVEDTDAPVIILNGDEKVSFYVGGDYEDAGATVIDACDGEVELDIKNNVSTEKEGTYEVIYSATDKAGNTATLKRIVEVKKPDPTNGIIYLTFDDGPSDINTPRLLDILKKYNVKATFFVTGTGSDDVLRREYNEGHSIGLHTFTHAYDYIYQDEGTFFSDLYRVQERVKNATGYTSTLMRFPGGSSNTVSARYDGGQRIMSKLTQSVQEKGFAYFDWNITSGDAGSTTSSDQVYRNVINALKRGTSNVVLQHDIKGFSVDAVERIIQYGLSQGYTFLPLNQSSFGAHQRVNN